MKNLLKLTIAAIIALIATLTVNAAPLTQADIASNPGESVTVTIDGEPAVEAKPFILCGATYVNFNDMSNALSLGDSDVEITVEEGSPLISALGRCLFSDYPTLEIAGELFVPIRQLAKIYGAEVHWEDSTRSVTLTRGSRRMVSGDEYYDSASLYWLSRIISAESRGEPLEGKIAVGNVILNRVLSAGFPDTIYGVIFDRKYGVQFTPTANGAIFNNPTEESVKAAKICLEGYSLSEDILYFMYEAIAVNKWMAYSRPYELTIGNHDFYS